MRKVLLFLFLRFAFSCAGQTVSVKETLSKIFIQIPDSFFKPLEKELPDSVKFTRAFRKSMIDSIYVSDNWTENPQFTVFDTVNCFLEMICKSGDPESLWTQIAFWNKKDGQKLVMMTINYSDMCVYEQNYTYFWNYDGEKFIAVNENVVLPDIRTEDCISASFLKKHKKVMKYVMPSRIGFETYNDTTTFNFSPEFYYLFSCGEYFTADVWYGLMEADIIRKEILLEWDGSKFTYTKSH
jgi:hypothetical protein